MDTTDVNTKLIDSYIGLLKNMSSQNKLEFMLRLTETVETDIVAEQAMFYKAFGGWDENESADELIRTIKDSRTFNRATEEL